MLVISVHIWRNTCLPSAHGTAGGAGPKLADAVRAVRQPYAIAKIAGIKLCENYNRQYSRRYVGVSTGCVALAYEDFLGRHVS